MEPKLAQYHHTAIMIHRSKYPTKMYAVTASKQDGEVGSREGSFFVKWRRTVNVLVNYIQMLLNQKYDA